MSSVFSSQDQFCPFWDQFCGFAYIIRLGDHFCLGITFAVVHPHVEAQVKKKETGTISKGSFSVKETKYDGSGSKDSRSEPLIPKVRTNSRPNCVGARVLIK